MAHKISFISQSGNVMKSSLALAMAVEASRNGLQVGVADLDREHLTLSEFRAQRLDMEIEPVFPVHEVKSAQDALKAFADEDLFIIDCPSRASQATLTVAQGSDLIVQPTTAGKKDLDLAIKTFYQLVAEGVDISRLLFVITRVGTAAELRKAEAYLKAAEIDGQNFAVLSSAIWEKPAYRSAMNDGFSIVETPYVTLNDAAKAVIHQILTVCLRHD